MTVLGIGAVVTVVVAFLGFVDSFLATVDRSEDEVAQAVPDRINVSLDGYRPEGSPAVSAVERAPGVAVAEPRLNLPGNLASDRASFAATITLLDFESEIWRPTISEGDAPDVGEPGIVIAEEAARDLGLEVGDELVVAHPDRRGSGAFTEARTTVPVSGLHPNPFRTFAYIDRSQARSMGMAGLANEIDIAPAPGASEDSIARALFGVPGVASVERATATTDFVRDRLDDFVGVLRLTVGFALALALLIAFNSTSISADERARENATMLAFGVPTREVVGLAIGESLITGIVGTLAGFGGGLLLIGWVVDETLPETLPDLGLVVSIGAGSMVAAALVGVIAVGLAPLLTARRIRRMDVPSTLRVVE
jgi:putative ABC transport system permease protein